MHEQNLRREQEIKLILQEKNKQIELIKKTETEKNAITDSLKQLFIEERTKSNKEM